MNTYYVYNSEMKLLATVQAERFTVVGDKTYFYVSSPEETRKVTTLCSYFSQSHAVLSEPAAAKSEDRINMKIFKVTNRGTGSTLYVAGHDIRREHDETFILINGIVNVSYSDAYYIQEFIE